MEHSFVDIGWIDLLGRLQIVRADAAVARETPPTISEADLTRGFGRSAPLLPGSIVLAPDWSSLRQLGSTTPLVLADLIEDGRPSPRCARGFLRQVTEVAAVQGLVISAAVELEFFLLDGADGRPVYSWIDNYALSQTTGMEVLDAVRRRLREIGIPIEATNPEYSGGQFEVNIGRAPALEAADNGALLRHYVREFAREHGYAATFMAKPWTAEAGSGMHVHQSLWRDGENVFFGGEDQLSADGLAYLAGLLDALPDFALFGSPTPNGYHRRADGSFAPTKVCWATDNRTTAVRAVVGGAGSTRIEHRDSGADANVHLALAAQILAGLDGIDRRLQPPPAVEGNAYEQDLPELPRTFLEAFERLERSELAARLIPEPLRRSYLETLRPEVEVMVCSTADWERARYAETRLA